MTATRSGFKTTWCPPSGGLEVRPDSETRLMRVPPKLLATSRRRWRAREAGLLALALVGARLANPDRPLPFDVCAFKILTGLPCPTCGLTRSLCHAVRGDWAASLAYHPAGMLLAVSLIGWIVWSASEAARGRPLGERVRSRLGMSLLASGAALSFVSWIVRLASGT